MISVRRDGVGLWQVTDGPFHDDYPCPLPDGGLASACGQVLDRFELPLWPDYQFRPDRPVALGSLAKRK